jgi:tetrapyrrole methylase family protein / MazG family protein
MLADRLAGMLALPLRLDPALQPGAGLQLMAAAEPFEPNPTVATLVYDLDGPANWERALSQLRRTLPPAAEVWLLRQEGRDERSTLEALRPPYDGIAGVYLPPVQPETAKRSLHGLRQIVHRLRAPGGCPWDRKQTHESLVSYVLEEAYEVADAIRHEGSAALAEELGDLLLQVFLHAEMAEEAGEFSLDDVVGSISAKLIRRHPHVFGDVVVGGASDVERNWEQLKAEEKTDRDSVLDGIPRSMPALGAAQEIQRKLKKEGFDWPDRVGVEAKLDEELAELRSAASPEAASGELGDLLFILTRLGLDLGADAEEALRGTNARVTRRFRYVESTVQAQGRKVGDLPLSELLAIWDEAKAREQAER